IIVAREEVGELELRLAIREIRLDLQRVEIDAQLIAPAHEGLAAVARRHRHAGDVGAEAQPIVGEHAEAAVELADDRLLAEPPEAADPLIEIVPDEQRAFLPARISPRLVRAIGRNVEDHVVEVAGHGAAHGRLFPRRLGHRAEKWVPVFRKSDAPTKNESGARDFQIPHAALDAYRIEQPGRGRVAIGNRRDAASLNEPLIGWLHERMPEADDIAITAVSTPKEGASSETWM